MPARDDLRPAGYGVKLTYDDYLLFPDDGQRHELIDGEHYVTPTPIIGHQRIVGNLHWLIRSYLEEHRVGQVFLSPLDVVLSRFDVVEPDLLYVSEKRATDVLTSTYVQGAPDLAIEIASPSTRKRDQTLKKRLYEQFGVAEDRLVDPKGETVRVYRRVGGRYARPRALSLERGEVLRTDLLPGLTLRLADIFKR